MRMNNRQSIQNGNIVLFNGAVTNPKTDQEVRNELWNAVKDIIQEGIKIVSAEYNSNSLEIHLLKDDKKQYLKLYDNGDYIYFFDTFN